MELRQLYGRPTADIYARAEMTGSLPLGANPAVLVVDLSNGFTRPESSFGTDMTATVETCRRVLDAARAVEAPVIFTTIAYGPTLEDAGLLRHKIPSVSQLIEGSWSSTIDPRLEPRPGEVVIVKKGASACFGTNLTAQLTTRQVDTVILCGATTSGCIRATAIDLMQYGFPAIVPADCVADRADGPHRASLFDLQAKYADVVMASDAIAYLEGRTST